MLEAAVGELGVNLVRDDDDVRIPQHVRDRFQVLPAHDGAGRVVGVGQYERLGARGDGRAQGLRREAEFLFKAGHDGPRLRARKGDARRVGDVGGLRDEHLVPGGAQRAQTQVDALARADGDEDFLRRIVFHVAAAPDVLRDQAAELDAPPVGGVLREAVLDRRNRRVPDVPGRDEVRLAHAQGDGLRHLRDDVEEPADAAGRHGPHALVDDALKIHHGLTARRRSALSPSKMTPPYL